MLPIYVRRQGRYNIVLDAEDKRLLEMVADLHKVPMGAYNIRKNGKSVLRNSSENILIETNEFSFLSI